MDRYRSPSDPSTEQSGAASRSTETTDERAEQRERASVAPHEALDRAWEELAATRTLPPRSR